MNRFFPSFLKSLSIGLITLAFLAGSQGCTEKGCTDPMAGNYNPDAQRDDGSCNYPFATDKQKEDFASFYAAAALAMYEDAYFQAEALREIVGIFVDNPTIPGLNACKDAWVLAHIPYSQSEVLSFPGSPIQDGSASPVAHRLNAWNFNPNWIDDGTDSGGVGIINRPDLYPEIDKELLLQLNHTQDGKRVTLGYHVIEYLLWGKDDEPVDEQTAGNRSFKDYDTSDSTIAYAARRASYLRLAVEQLSIDLAQMVNAWSPLVSGNYYSQFKAFTPRKQTRLAITGLVLFGQYTLGDFRIEKTLTGDDPEREESTFSDNTHRDAYFNVVGMQSLFNGSYGRTDSTYVEGTSLFSVVNEVDSGAAQLLKTQMSEVADASAELLSPYDYYMWLEQASGVGNITDLAIALEEFGEHMTESATELNMGIEKDLPQEE